MTDFEDQKKLILDQERKFAAQLCRYVLNKPMLNSWMILIPFIFIFYFQDLAKYKKGKRGFTENFLLTRNKTLDEVEQALTENRKIDVESIAKQASISSKAGGKYAEVMAVLAEHYSVLLKGGRGATYEEMLKSAYGNRKKYMIYLEKIDRAEKALNKALRPELEKSTEGVADIVSTIERYSEKIRLNDAKEFFA